MKDIGKMLKNMLKNMPKQMLIMGAACVILALITIIVYAVPKQPVIGEFTPPEFETNAQAGMPEPPEDSGYWEIYQEGMSFSAWVCGGVVCEENEAVVYFTSPESNNVWLKIRICDEQGATLGESGLIKPGEYVRSVTLNKALVAGTPIQMKLMGYEPDTYFSAGSVSIRTTIVR